jgi:hypothetical protein
MIVLRPDRVEFDDVVWDGVVRVAIDRVSARTIEGYDESGSYATLVDVTRQRVVIRVTQEIVGDDLEAPIPGQMGELEMIAGNGTELDRRRVRCDCVIESVQNKISEYGATRSIVLIAQSDSGENDPVRITSP